MPAFEASSKARNFSYVCDGPVCEKCKRTASRENRGIFCGVVIAAFASLAGGVEAGECDAQLIISEYMAPFGGINLAGLKAD